MHYYELAMKTFQVAGRKVDTRCAKQAYFAVLAAMAVTLLVTLTSCKSETSQPKNQSRKDASPPVVIQLASKYEAIHNWYEGLEGFKRTYTVDVEQALIEGPKGKPIIAEGDVHDVFRRDGQTWIRVSKGFSLGPPIDFEISCPKEKLKPIFEHREAFNFFAVVATIRKVQKAHLELRAIATDGTDTEIELTPPSLPPFGDRFIAIGDCLDLAYVGETASGLLRGER